MQSYYNFFPKKNQLEMDRFMPVANIRNCPKHDRILLQFLYPSSCRPKEIYVIPNISQNLISMNSRSDKNTITWLANRSTATVSESVNSS